MDVNTITAIVTATIALFALFHSIKTQKEINKDNKNRLTIEAFNRLQDQVLDKMVSISNYDIFVIIEEMDYEPKMKEAYDDCRALIAKCEHFAIGVNKNIYDYELVALLGGKHLVYLFDKVRPVTDIARENGNGQTYYSEFERLIERLNENLQIE